MFAEALTSVLNDERLAGALQEFLLPTGISTAINRYFREHRPQPAHHGLRNPTWATMTLPFSANPRFQASIPVGVDLQDAEAPQKHGAEDVLSHWGPRGRGVELESANRLVFYGTHPDSA